MPLVVVVGALERHGDFFARFPVDVVATALPEGRKLHRRRDTRSCTPVEPVGEGVLHTAAVAAARRVGGGVAVVLGQLDWYAREQHTRPSGGIGGRRQQVPL
jgi:hypothetical protein